MHNTDRNIVIILLHQVAAHNVARELSQVPNKFWAKSKCDVGLIRNAEPVVITPESDYRPKKYQNPLKQEALDGICPVFWQYLFIKKHKFVCCLSLVYSVVCRWTPCCLKHSEPGAEEIVRLYTIHYLVKT